MITVVPWEADDPAEAAAYPYPVIFSGMPDAVYNALPETRATTLKVAMGRSPLHALHALEEEEPAASAPRLIGALAHEMMISPDAWEERYAVCPFETRRATNEYKAWFASLPDGMPVVTAAQVEAASKIVAAVYAHPHTGPIVGGALYHEVVVLWEEVVAPPDGPPLRVGYKAKADFLTPDEERPGQYILADLKSARTAQPDDFGSAAYDLGYPLQLEHYTRGFTRAGVTISGTRIIAVENSPPWVPVLFKPSERFITYGRREWHIAHGLWAECIRTGKYPTYGERPEILELPRYAGRDLLD